MRLAVPCGTPFPRRIHLGPPAAGQRSRTYRSARGAESGRACQAAVRGPELTGKRIGRVRSDGSGMASLAEIAGLSPPASASGAGVCEGDFPAMPQARHRLQCDCGTLLRGLLPPDPQELWLWLHRFEPVRHHGRA
jgi:hypothetical protein